MMSRLAILCLCAVAAASAATLRQLSMDELTQSATAIVRARVVGSTASLSGSTIYTHYKLQVTETLKGAALSDVVLPGGVVKGVRQSFPGVPELQQGPEYVLFLWTSSTGLTHVLGMSQGVFNISQLSDGSLQMGRGRIAETVHDAAGRVVVDQPVSLRLSDLRQLLNPVPAAAARQ
jgi:hypothetical protein